MILENITRISVDLDQCSKGCFRIFLRKMLIARLYSTNIIKICRHGYYLGFVIQNSRRGVNKIYLNFHIHGVRCVH